ncbi:DUF456 domain-containing protein [Psychroflexus salinarum]|uniref:DUF456 domain-containing protein n=2 Tax=Psychroflexus salinarum TaxID=546024 RepID=A0ABW3GQW7_9FLAO
MFKFDFREIKHMSILLISLGFICCIVGIIGSLLPVLPGLPISWICILLLYFVPEVEVSSSMLWITFTITLVIFILDYLIPIFGVNKYGGSKYGVYGAGIGLVIGLFTPIPFDFLIFSFLGAYLSEVIFSKMDRDQALRAAFGSFIGFLTSTFIEFVGALAFMIIFCYKVIQYREFLF